MKHSGWNPIRRNKKIGTKKHGYSQNNKLVIPEQSQDSHIYWERLIDPVACPLEIQGHQITLLVEPTKQGYVYTCTPSDIIRVLELIDREHLEVIELVILRQPTKKQEILQPVWGRFTSNADINYKYSGVSIILEAVPIGLILKWTDKLDSYGRKELLSLEKDGHKIEKVKRGYDIITTPESLRNTQLFRTLPHEIGHAVDYLENSLKPSLAAKTDEESASIKRLYRSKPYLDKEEYAHRYARELYHKYSAQGLLPFERLYDENYLNSLRLDPKWFKF